MPQETPARHRKVARVMHAFKEGRLESGSGGKVRSRRQAVAIGLSEAGVPRRPARRPRPAAREATRAELYAEARRRGLTGVSRLSKAALQKALRRRRRPGGD